MRCPSVGAGPRNDEVWKSGCFLRQSNLNVFLEGLSPLPCPILRVGMEGARRKQKILASQGPGFTHMLCKDKSKKTQSKKSEGLSTSLNSATQ